MRRSISSCLCGCHYQGIGYCKRCSKHHENEKTSNEIRVERLDRIRINKKRRKL